MTLNHVARILDKLLDVFIFTVVVLILLISTYSLYDNYSQYEAARDPKLAQFKPDAEQQEVLTVEKRITENQVAWVTLDGTPIDFPVMQGEDNYEYLNKNPYGEYSLAGSIFLDSDNDPHFTDEYSLLYGHHMDHDTMFGSLGDYTERTFYESHRIGTLITDEAVYELRLFAVSHADGGDMRIFSPKDRTTREVLAFLEENALIYEPVPEDSRLLCLSTCYGDSLLSRLIVVGTITPRGEAGES